MIVKSEHGMQVSLLDTDKKSLFDSEKREWERYPEGDDKGKYLICYKDTTTGDRVLLTKSEILRVLQGPKAMQNPTTVDEMRDCIRRSHKYMRDVADPWPDQRLREILIKAEETGRNAEQLLEKEVDDELERSRPKEQPKEATEKATEAREDKRTARSASKTRKKEEAVSVALEEGSVSLTPKQLEFMERLSECPDWSKSGVDGFYTASEYAQELSDTMNPMTVGAVLTTLREKGLIRTEKRRVGAIKCCIFQLTDLGVRIYNKLAGGRA